MRYFVLVGDKLQYFHSKADPKCRQEFSVRGCVVVVDPSSLAPKPVNAVVAASCPVTAAASAQAAGAACDQVVGDYTFIINPSGVMRHYELIASTRADMDGWVADVRKHSGIDMSTYTDIGGGSTIIGSGSGKEISTSTSAHGELFPTRRRAEPATTANSASSDHQLHPKQSSQAAAAANTNSNHQSGGLLAGLGLVSSTPAIGSSGNVGMKGTLGGVDAKIAAVAVAEKKDPRSLKEGFVLKASSHVKAMDMDWKVRFMMLAEDGSHIKLYRHRSDTKPTGELLLIGASVQEEPDVGHYEIPVKYTFSITPQTHNARKFYFAVEKEDEMKEWVEAMQSQLYMLEHSRHADLKALLSSVGKGGGGLTMASLRDLANKPLKEGTLQKKGLNFSQARSRIFRLYVNRLEYYRSRGDIKPAGVIDLNGCVDELEPHVGATAFSLKTMGSTRKYVVIAESESEMDDWLEAIRATVSKLKQYSVDPHSVREGFLSVLEGGSKLVPRYVILSGHANLKYYARKPVSLVRVHYIDVDMLSLCLSLLLFIASHTDDCVVRGVWGRRRSRSLRSV